MARVTECTFEGRPISIWEAISFRDAARRVERQKLDFRCEECTRRVRPHRSSEYGAPHFEHLSRNPKCTLSDPAR